MLRFTFTLAAFMLLLASRTFAQQPTSFSITGKITSEDPSGAILYLLSPDLHIIKTETADANGNFRFDALAASDYVLRVVSGGQIAFEKTLSVSKDIHLEEIPISSHVALSEVVVEKKRPYLERQEGKMILNVDSSIGSTGASAFEILEKAPGVNIDNNDNISLRGKSGLIIQIDGKLTPMTGTNLANYLRGLPSNAIDKIEFITNPGAKYDAAGSAVINIRLKKDKRRGTNGSISTSYGQGRYPKTNNAVNLNHRSGKWNIFGMYSFAYREGFSELLLNRRFSENGLPTGRYDQSNLLKMDFRNHLGRVGIDYTPSDRHSFSFSTNGVSNRFNPKGNNRSQVFDAADVPIAFFTTDNRSRDHWYNGSANLNHKFTLDTLGTELVTDLDVARYGNATTQRFTTKYFALDGNALQPDYLLDGDIDGKLSLYALKSDFSKVLRNKLKIETGVKSSYVKADNDLKFYDSSSGTPVFDPTKSNHFIYTENINAAYFNLSRDFGRWGTFLGIRTENTNVTGKQLVDNTRFDRSYTQLFPSVFASYKWSDNHSTEFNYSRRITRPGYDQLNPFKFFLDPTTYKEGNPYLNPQTVHSFEFTHIYAQKWYATLSFSRTNDNITEVIAPLDDNPQITVQTSRNLDTADIFGLFLIVPEQIAPWWNTSNSLNMYYGSYSGTVASTTINNQGNFTFNLNSVNTFKLGKGFSAELTGNYRAREIYAFMEVRPIWFVNCGIQKKFENNSVLKLALNDVFYTNRTTADTRFSGYDERFRVRRDTRVAVLSYVYAFGKANGQPRRRTGGADDIKQRASSGNG